MLSRARFWSNLARAGCTLQFIINSLNPQVYLARLTADDPSTVGKHNGIFTSIFTIGAIFGSTVGATVFATGGGVKPAKDVIVKLLWSLFSIQAIGVSLFALMKYVDNLEA